MTLIARFAVLSAASVAASCVTLGAPAPEAPVSAHENLAGEAIAEKRVTAASVVHGFAEAVVNHCLPAVEAGAPVEEGASQETIRVVLDNARGIEPFFDEYFTARGYTYSVTGTRDIVMLGNGEGPWTCRVAAFGPPVEDSFDAVAGGVLAAGYEELTLGAQSHPLIFERRFVYRAGEHDYEVTLSGNEPGAPGARSRYSTLLAEVRERAPEPAPPMLDTGGS